jgi:hypothetical protein
MPGDDPLEDPLGDPFDGLLADLERQAEGLHLADRAVEVAELRIAQYAEVELIARLHAATGRPIRVGTVDGWNVEGELVGTGADWIVLEAGTDRGWALNLQLVVTIAGPGDGSVPQEARPLSARLSLRSILRRASEAGEPVAVRVTSGQVLHGMLAGVGADFVELIRDSGEATVIPLAALIGVRLRSALGSAPGSGGAS